MATIRLIPSTYTRSDNSYVTVNNPNNMYHNTDNSSGYTTLQGRAGSSYYGNNTYYAFINGFNFDDVPSNVTITGFRVLIKAYRGNYQSTGNSNYRICLASQASNSYKIGNTTLSKDITTSSNGEVYEIPTGSLTWNNLIEYGSNFSIDIPLRNSSTSNRNYPYVYVYGAEIEVTYIPNVTYDISTLVQTNKVISVSPASTQSVGEGDNFILRINTSYTTNDFKVEDNGIDVTDQLVQKENTDTTINAVALSDYDTEFSSNGAQFYATGSNTGPVNGILAIGYTAESPNPNTPTGTSVGDYMYVKDSNGGGSASGSLVFNFDFSSIPENAIIESVSISAYGCQESDSSSTDTDVCKLGAYSGSVLKGSEQDITRTSNGITTMSNVGTWTRQELQNAKLKFTVGYYGGRLGGITWSVTYSIPSANPYYWEYTLNNVSADHTIIISDKIIEIPEEDPAKIYYPITISGINCTTDPSKGTTRVEAGTNQTITIYPTESQVTLITDNGVDVSSQLVQHGEAIPDPVYSTPSGASYGFILNSNNFYESNNKGRSQTVAIERVTFNLPVRCLVTLKYINYAEATYDYGMFGNIDIALDTVNHEEGANGVNNATNLKVLLSSSEDNSPNEKTLTYEVPAGNHFIEAKFSKDKYTDGNNDSLQFKIDSIEPLEPNNYYTYTLSNINQEHSLIFIFGDVIYYFVNSSVNGEAILYPNGSMVILPEDNYTLTIVPKVADGTLMLTDNNVGRTSQIQTKTTTITKGGQEVTVTNYIYSLSNIQATHNIVVNYTTQSSYNIRQVVNSSDISINPSGNQEVDAGTNYSVNITVTKPGTITVNDNILGDTDYVVTVSDVSGGSKTVTHTLTNIRVSKTLTFDFTELTKYNVTASENSSYLSIPSGYTSQSVYSGQSCSVKFTSTAPGTITISDNGTNTNYPVTANGTITHTISSVTTAHTVLATFTIASYTVTTSLKSGSKSVTINPASSNVNYNSSYTVTLTPSVPGTLTISEGSTTLQTWTIPVGNLAAKTYTVNNITAAHTYTVNLTELTKYTVSASENSTYLSIPSGYTSQSIYSGQSCDVKFTSTTPGTITVTDNGTNTNYPVTANGTITHTISSVTAAHTVTATFTIASYQVSASVASGSSSVTLNPSTAQSINHGSAYTLNITPSVPGTITIKEGNTTVQTYTINVGNLSTKTFTVNNITAAHTYTVNLTELTKYTVSASENSSYLSIPSGYTSQSIYSGQSCDVKFTSNTPGTITVSDNGTNTNYPVTANGTITHTISSVTAAHTVTATFTIASYTVTTSLKSGSKTVTINPASSNVNHNSSYTVTLTPSVPGTLTISEGSTTLQTWTIPVGDLSTKTYTVNNITAAHTYTVNLTELTKYTVSASENSEYLSIPSGYTSQSIYSGQSCDVKFTATIPGALTVTDNGDSSSYQVTASNQTITHTINSVTTNHTVTATFTTVTYNVAASVKSGSASVTLNPSGTQPIGHGSTYNLSITPSVPGTLTISEGSTTLETWTIPVGNLAAKTYTVENITSAHTYVVNLTELTKYTVTASESSEYLSIPSGYTSQSIYSGQSCNVKFTSTTPGTITVSDNGTNTNYTVTANGTITHTISSVTAAHTVTATFTIATYSVSASSSVTGVTLTPASQTINHGGSASITVKSTKPGTVVITDNGTDSSYVINAANGTNTHTISSVIAAHNITVKSFTLAKYTVTATKGSDITSVSPASQSLDYGSNVSLNVTPTVPGTLYIKETNLPYDAEIEYLESTGTQYIDLGIIPDANTGAYANVVCSDNTDIYFFGLRNDSGNTRWGAGHSSGGFYYCYGNYGSTIRLTGYSAEIYLNYLNDGNYISTNGTTTKQGALPSLPFTPALNIYLFGCAYINTINKWKGKFYSFKLTQGSDIVIDMIPVRVGTVGYMYDKVSGQLFGNSGTGNFTLGPDVDTSGTLTIYEQEISPSEAGTSITCSNIYTNLSANHSVTASVLGLDQHTITVTNNSSSILSYTPSSPISIYDGETLTINFVPTQPGTLTVTDSVSSSNNQTYTISISDVNKAKVYTIANVTADRTITANLTIATYTVTASSSVTGVTLTPASQTINHNGNATITVKSTRPGTVVITDNGTDSSYTINAANGTATHIISSVTAVHTVTVKSFTIASYTVTMSKASGSSNVTINPASTSINYGSSYSVTLTPSVPGTMVVKEGNTTKETWTIPVGNLTAKTFTVSNITAAHTYTVTLTELTKYNVSVTNNASNVTVTPSTTQSIYSGQNAVIQLKTNKAGTILVNDNVSGNTTTLTYTESEINTNKSYTLTNVTADHTLTITFADKTYQVSVSEDSEYLAITSTTPAEIVSKGTYQVKASVSIPGTVILKQGNTTLNTQTISSVNGTYSYNITNIDENKYLTLEFTPTQFTVTTESLSSDITIVSGATYTGIYGETYTLQYKCSTISTVTINKDGSSTSVVIGSSDINRTKTYTTIITGNHEITLSNSLTTYDITGSISSGETYIKFVDGSTDKTTISKTVNADTSYTIYVKSTMPGKLTVTINGAATSVTLPQTYTYPYTYSQTIDNILEDKTITLGFDVLKYNIDTESGTTSVIYNQPYTYKFTPAYAGTYMLYDNDSLVQTYTISASQVGTEQSYTINHVTGAHSFSITSDIQKYTVSVTNSAQKYIADYSISKSAPAYHESSTISIMPRVKGTINISDNGTNSSITTDGSVKTYTISNIEDNHDIILLFTPGAYTVTIVNNIPSNYDLTLSKAAGNHNVTACENFTLILTVNSGSKDTMNGKINISSTAGNASYGVVMDTHMSRTYTINEILQNITITLSFEESDMAPIVGNKFLKAFETRSKQQEYVAENNTNPLISFITTISEVDYTSHYGDMRYVNTEYRDGNADNLFKR